MSTKKMTTTKRIAKKETLVINKVDEVKKRQDRVNAATIDFNEFHKAWQEKHGCVIIPEMVIRNGSVTAKMVICPKE